MSKSNTPATAMSPATPDMRAVWEEHRGWLRTVVWARLRDPQAVEEVLQEVALAAARGLGGVRDPSRLGPWLYQIAVRHVLLYRRRAGRNRRLIERFATDRPGSPAPDTYDPLAWLLAEERRTILRRALDQLPRRDSEILLLKYTENWTYRQLADHLGIRRAAVEARLHRARKRMRTALMVLDPGLRPLARHEHV